MSSPEKQNLSSRLVISRRHAIMGGMLVAAGGLAAFRHPQLRYPHVEKETFKEWIPDRFAGWQRLGAGDVVLPPPDALSDRLYDNLETGAYRHSNGDEIMTLLAYNNTQDGMLQVHRPEVCYPVGGYTLTNTAATTLDMAGRKIPSSSFTATSFDRVEHVLYFTRIGPSFPRSWARQRATVMEANLRGYIPDGIMFRISTLIADPSAAKAAMESFGQAFYLASSPQLQKLLVGKS